MYKFERGSHSNSDQFSVTLTADQVARIDAIPHHYLELADIVVAGLLALADEAKANKAKAEAKRLKRAEVS